VFTVAFCPFPPLSQIIDFGRTAKGYSLIFGCQVRNYKMLDHTVEEQTHYRRGHCEYEHCIPRGPRYADEFQKHQGDAKEDELAQKALRKCPFSSNG
jgi:hypothetical protein